MKESFIFLCSEVTREHAACLARWMRDAEVRRYLSDPGNIASAIERAVEASQLPIVTHLFSRDGRFLMACDRDGEPVGFVRLIPGHDETEIVAVIGEKTRWGQGCGTRAIEESLKIAFFELRARRVLARIHPENWRSAQAFVRCGFRLTSETPAIRRYALCAQDYFRLVRQRAHASGEIEITVVDHNRLRGLIGQTFSNIRGADDTALDLRHELKRARIVEPRQIPRGIVTMNSRALLTFAGHEAEVSLVYPGCADEAGNRVSVLSPVGAAILGYGENACIRWEMPDGPKDILIREVLYQPEATGDYHL
jgi:regulator of nucleoside diphosphate kinase